MRIIYDGTIFLRQPYGGVSRYISNLIKYISLSADVNVIAPFHQNLHLDDLKLVNSKNKYLGPISSITSRILSPCNFCLTRKEIFKLKPHIVHESYYNFCSVAPKLTKIVITVHDMISEKYPAFLPFYDFSRNAKKISIYRADHIICVSESTKKDLLNIYDLEEKKLVWYIMELQTSMLVILVLTLMKDISLFSYMLDKDGVIKILIFLLNLFHSLPT